MRRIRKNEAEEKNDKEDQRGGCMVRQKGRGHIQKIWRRSGGGRVEGVTQQIGSTWSGVTMETITLPPQESAMSSD